MEQTLLNLKSAVCRLKAVRNQTLIKTDGSLRDYSNPTLARESQFSLSRCNEQVASKPSLIQKELSQTTQTEFQRRSQTILQAGLNHHKQSHILTPNLDRNRNGQENNIGYTQGINFMSADARRTKSKSFYMPNYDKKSDQKLLNPNLMPAS
jgi:hypothetical protein